MVRKKGKAGSDGSRKVGDGMQDHQTSRKFLRLDLGELGLN